MCCRSPRSATSAFITLTRTSPCGRMHVTATVSSCFAALRQLLSVRRCPPQQALLTLIRALVISKVDYCCSVLVGVSGHLLDRLQSVLNAAARLDTVPPLCTDVPLSQRHISVLPRWQYLPGGWRRGPPSPALVSHINSWVSSMSGDQPWATDHSLSPLHGHGTVCRQPYGLHRRSPLSDENWKHFFIARVFWTTSRQFSFLLCYMPVPHWLRKVPLQRSAWQCHFK